MSGHSFIPYPVVISSPLLDRLPSCDEKEKRFISCLQALVRIFNGRFSFSYKRATLKFNLSLFIDNCISTISHANQRQIISLCDKYPQKSVWIGRHFVFYFSSWKRTFYLLTLPWTHTTRKWINLILPMSLCNFMWLQISRDNHFKRRLKCGQFST